MGIFGSDSSFEDMLKQYHRLHERVEQATATAPAPAPATQSAPAPVVCPKCKCTITIDAKYKDWPLWKLKCLGCKTWLAKNPITVEFCVWLQNEWAEEIREQGKE